MPAFGATILLMMYPSSMSLLAFLPQNSPPNTQTLSVSASMPSAMLLAGGMSMGKRLFY